jgi:hypothetical protein
MALSGSTNPDLRRAAAVAALAAYVGLAAALYHTETRMQETGEALAQRHRAIESRFLGVSSYLDRLEKTSNPPPSLKSRLRREQNDVLEERRESTQEYNTWKEQSSAWTVKRWVALTFATMACLPVVLWGFQSWGVWTRYKRLNRPQDQ